MPGSSLWLTPPPKSDLYKAIQFLINSSLFPEAEAQAPHFTPHLTLSADTIPIDHQASKENPQEWLKCLSLPSDLSNLKITIREPQTEHPYFRKLSLRCEKTKELCELAAFARAATNIGELEGAREWVRAEGEYRPHVSLMYSDLPSSEVAARMNAVKEKIEQAKKQFPYCRTTRGAFVCLLPTEKPVKDWIAVAERYLPEVEWIWES